MSSLCGIIGILLQKKGLLSKPLGTAIKECLKNLEYRGYDSVGFAILSDNGLIIRKSKGKIDDVVSKLSFDEFDGVCGIGHTRWATHGRPSDTNAHPHTDCTGKVAVIHNGIIENYLEIKDLLIRRGHVFKSETDTEVIAHLIEEYKKLGFSPYDAFKKAASLLKGSYALSALDLDDAGKIFFARNTSPLIIGLTDKAKFLSSDIPAFLEYSRNIIVVQDDEVGYLSNDSVVIEKLVDKSYEFDKNPATAEVVNYASRIRYIDWSPEMARKGGYPHYMLKEIHEQPQAVSNTLISLMNELGDVIKLLSKAERVLIVGSGTSYHASFIGSLLLNELANIKSHAIISSEMRWFVNGVNSEDVVIAVSQSGETIDTLLAVREVKKRGALTLALTNIIDSALARESHLAMYTRAGPEIGVAATKTYTTQVVSLALIAVKLAEYLRTVPESKLSELSTELRELPNTLSSVISASEPKARALSSIVGTKHSMYFLGRGLGLPTSMEGALKLKEISYIHAESYPAGESKHGPIALVDDGFPVAFTILGDEVDMIFSNVEEMRARGAWTLAVMPKGFERISKHFNYVFELNRVAYELAPAVYIAPYQLLAYYTAISRGFDPDKPRNLAKTVTVV
ncbi:MAG: glutamine--fructose-6-phosphate transaminase (isomerizing) [Sulfolobales archaeon]|nr:glutamine--fructose-6-phosphate transaminase (isomerizing) [Sulfolobales archaeon]MCX8186279.1 glutamine--fructose-6-phosphate transaminase (isomerizing) [Sulfolobales archaeon]MDW7968985.1 glutamine--fructose-6-phosphate transaminase (isomerizing) [Sulfolobales archaeon]